jgi:hypothetical protein
MDHPLSTMQINKEMKAPLKSSCDRRQKKTTEKSSRASLTQIPSASRLNEAGCELLILLSLIA